MVDAPVDFEVDFDNVENLPNVPVCPICITPLESAARDYQYARLIPDTRWFYCTDCEAHLGYHRLKGTWKLDPYDYTSNDKLRERIGLEPAGK